ncbi:MAG: PDZ domain-containing protein [Candidatus Liberibacter ctenarytainae]|uniref:Probable periplasmic serine endoprotease DegP-like n=1 Tax=Candidatus Liberibacter ctenarytainae TaxID=2020335 RepID=A0A937ARR0_9HYPH|nr:PDZ domain-containing protein [Candidatus Liberibacter ctenarytainae]
MFKFQVLSVRTVVCTMALVCTCLVGGGISSASVDLSPVVERVFPSVVSLRVEFDLRAKMALEAGNGSGFPNDIEEDLLQKFFRDRFRKKGLDDESGRVVSNTGSGFFFNKDGYIVTNNHVVENGVRFTVILDDNTELPAKLVGGDAITDLAVLKVERKSSKKFVPVEFADSDNVRVGETVFTIGSPMGLRGSVNAGIVSARNRSIGPNIQAKYIQIDAMINKGNSGGPCFNVLGGVLGVNANILTLNFSGSNMGIGFVIPSSVVTKIVPILIEKGVVDRGWVGIVMQNLTEDLAIPLGLKNINGVLVSSVIKKSPAEKAGIKIGDVICELDGKEIKNPNDVAWRIGSNGPGTKIKLSLCKGGGKHPVYLVLGSSSVEKTRLEKMTSTKELLGINLQEINSEDQKTVRILFLDPSSEAAKKGLRAGMYIVSVNNQKVFSINDIERLIEQAKEKKIPSVLLQVSKAAVPNNKSGEQFNNENGNFDCFNWFLSLNIK